MSITVDTWNFSWTNQSENCMLNWPIRDVPQSGSANKADQ